ncbi:MAG: ribosomal protein S18-alanine N-acetyltransferase, partial [Bacillota bacterium]|nr:ribosomal protein S18-alanine N-acetyltransferase [Bacillota bacterium]
MDENIRKMNIFDLKEVMRIEKISFVSKWTIDDFIYELIINTKATYFIYKIGNSIVAYIGIWILDDEIHISNLAVDPLFRRRGIARKLINRIIKEAYRVNIKTVSLEVRISNINAINLYENMDFEKNSILKDYYKV